MFLGVQSEPRPGWSEARLAVLQGKEDRGCWRQADLCALRWWVLSVPLKCCFAVLFMLTALVPAEVEGVREDCKR